MLMKECPHGNGDAPTNCNACLRDAYFNQQHDVKDLEHKLARMERIVNAKDTILASVVIVTIGLVLSLLIYTIYRYNAAALTAPYVEWSVSCKGSNCPKAPTQESYR